MNSNHQKTEIKQHRRRTCEKQIHCRRFVQNKFNVKCDNETNWRNAVIRHNQRLTFRNDENNQKHCKYYIRFMQQIEWNQKFERAFVKQKSIHIFENELIYFCLTLLIVLIDIMQSNDKFFIDRFCAFLMFNVLIEIFLKNDEHEFRQKSLNVNDVKIYF